MKRKLLILFIPIFSGFISFAANPFIKNYTVDEGIPTNRVEYLYQDSKGFMWFATDAGVLRYDGNNFTRLSPGGSDDDRIHKIKEDNEGRIWFFNANGTMSFYKENVIYNETNAPFLSMLKSDYIPLDFYEDSDSTLYIYNSASEVFAVKNNQLVDFRNFGFNNASYSSGLQLFTKSVEGNFLLFTSKGVYETSDFNDDLTLKQGPGEGLKVRTFSTQKYEAYMIDIQGNVSFYKNGILTKENVMKFNAYTIEEIILDNDGFVWISTVDQGVFCYDDDNLLLHLDIPRASSTFDDGQNNIWISSSSNGIYKVSRDIFKYSYLGIENFDGNGIIDLEKSNDNNVLTTNGNSLFLIHNKKPLRINQNTEGVFVDYIYQTKNNSLITKNVDGTEISLIKNVYYDREQDTVVYGEFVKLSNVRFSGKIFSDQKGLNYFAHYSDYLLWIESTIGNDSITYWYIKTNLGRIHSIFRTNNNNLIINTPLKNYYVNLDDFQPQSNFSVHVDSTFSLLDGSLISSYINIDGSNEILNVQNKYIYLLHNDKSLFQILEDNKQIDSPILSLTHIDSMLFFSTAKTVYFISNPLNVIKNEPLVLNRLNIEFNNINDILCSDSTLFVASEDGIIFIPLQSISGESIDPPRPYVNSVSIEDENYDLSKGIVKYKNRKRLSIEFSCLNYTSFPSNYTYMLEGVDENWGEGNESRVVYLNLPPGEYDFKLKARRGTEDYSEEIILPVIVSPTLIQRTGTKIFLLAVFLFIIFVVVRTVYTNKIKKNENESTLITLEHKALQSMMNPHFIFNSLGSIQQYLLQNKPSEAGTYLSQFARLIRQNMNSLRSNSICIDDEVERLRNYLELEKFRMGNKFKFSIHVDDKIESDEVCIPSMIVQPFAENAVWHGVSSIDYEGIITVNFIHKDEKSILITVEDNGGGIKKENGVTISEQNLNMGVSITEKRLSLIGKKTNIETKIIYEDLFPNIENCGTKVTLVVPVITL